MLEKGKMIAAALLAFFCLLGAAPSAYGEEPPAFSMALNETAGSQGDTVKLAVSYNGELGELGAFFIAVDFDPDRFAYEGVKASPTVREGYSETREEGDRILSAYAAKRREDCLAQPGELFTYTFRLRETAEPGEAGFSLEAYEMTDPTGNPLNLESQDSLAYTVRPAPGKDASLLSLMPEQGVLEPEFSPDCFEYALSVPFEVKTLAFMAEPAEGASVKVNRKTLGAAGSDTRFLLTVTAEDGKTKAVYQVTARRQEKLSPSPSAKPSPSPKSEQPLTAERKSTPTPEKPANPSSLPESGTEKTPKPEKTGQPEKTPAPQEKAAVSRSEGGKGGGGTGISAAPVLTVQNGQSSLAPSALACLFFLAVFVVSRPLAKWLCGRFPEEKAEGEKREKERKDQEKGEDEEKRKSEKETKDGEETPK